MRVLRNVVVKRKKESQLLKRVEILRDFCFIVYLF